MLIVSQRSSVLMDLWVHRRRERADREAKRAEEEAAKQAAAAEKEAQQAAELDRLAAERAEREAAGIQVSSGASIGKNWATSRKTVSKMSNKIVGLKKRQREEEEEDIADVFKM